MLGGWRESSAEGREAAELSGSGQFVKTAISSCAEAEPKLQPCSPNAVRSRGSHSSPPPPPAQPQTAPRINLYTRPSGTENAFDLLQNPAGR